MTSRIQLIFAYDGDDIGDLWPYCDGGLSFSKKRNAVGSIDFGMSLRKIAEWCASRNFDVKRMFTPIRSTVVLYKDGRPVVGGWLEAAPDFTLAEAPDAIAQLSFVDWLGLTAGATIHPLETYGPTPFNIVAAQYTQQIIDRTAAAGRVWPISIGDSDTLAAVQGTIDSVKTLKDFLLERTDNMQGTQSFDVYFDPFGVMQIRQRYGYDITGSAVFSYPDGGGKYGVKSISLPPWDNYVSDFFLTGAGNGYNDESGEGGTAIISQQRNQATIENTGYWEGASSESDISEQATLDARATSYLKDTDKPFSTPSITIDADPFILCAHEEGGNLWVGDTVQVNVASWAAQIMPLDISQKWRISEVNATIDTQEHTSAQLVMMAND